MTSPTLPDHATHGHRLYVLTCEQYEDLLAECGRRCQTCGKPAAETALGRLVIDHDNFVGKWAVRGLLCSRCNGMIRYDRPVPDWAAPYVASPWWRRMLDGRGLAPEVPEPDAERVRDFIGRRWFRHPEGWTTGHKRRIPLSWRQLLHEFGPHGLTVLSNLPLCVLRGRPHWLAAGYPPGMTGRSTGPTLRRGGRSFSNT